MFGCQFATIQIECTGPQDLGDGPALRDPARFLNGKRKDGNQVRDPHVAKHGWETSKNGSFEWGKHGKSIELKGSYVKIARGYLLNGIRMTIYDNCLSLSRIICPYLAV